MTSSLSPAAAFLLLLASLLLPASATTIGATYSASTYPLPPPPERISASAACLGLSAVRLDAAEPSLVRAFLYSNTSLLLTVPNSLVPPHRRQPLQRPPVALLQRGPLPPPRLRLRHLRRRRPDVLLPSRVRRPPPPRHPQPPPLPPRPRHPPCLRLHHLLLRPRHHLPLPPPSAATFIDAPPLNAVIRPLLQHLRDTNSSFHVNLYPYFLYRLRSEIPIGFALFQDHPFSFRDDMARYRNLFDMMLIVSETGWPSSSGDPGEVEANPVYAELYVKGLLGHLKSGRGSPLRREGAEQVYIYEMMDKQVGRMGGRNWGILYANLTSKYKGVDYRSESDDRRRGFGVLKMVVGQLLVFALIELGVKWDQLVLD